jgi:transcriptional regulator with XRE-family HTH domain
MLPRADPGWWRRGTFEGQPISQILRRRDVTSLFRFLKRRGWSRAAIAAATGLSETRVRQICQARQQVTSYDVLERIAAGLQIDRGLIGLGYSEDLAAAARPSEAPQPDPTADPDFVGSLAAMAVGRVPVNPDRLLPPPPSVALGSPATVTGVHVCVLREISEQHRRFDAEHGGGACRESGAAYVRWAHGMLSGRCDTSTTYRELRAALSDLYQIVGWASHDLGDHTGARTYLTAGLALAREIDNLGLISAAFYRLGRVSIHQGRAEDALKLWQLGQIVAQDGGCLVSVAVLHANEAWAYALLCADERVRDALARSQAELGRVDVDTAPSWARFFLAPADFDGISAVAYGCLAGHHEHRARYAPAALERAERALARRRAGEARSRTFDAISLATGYLLDAQPKTFEQHGHVAVDLTIGSASARAVDRLRGMAEYAMPYAAHSGVAAVLERIAALPNG